MKDRLQEIDIQWIVVNPNQPRRIFCMQELEELAASIEEVGLIHPPIVREIGAKKFEIVAGERRYRASKLLGRTTLPVVVRDESDQGSSHAALIENIQRVDLNAMEVAHAFKELMLRFELTQEQLADKVGKKRSTIANFLRLLQLPEAIQTYIGSGELTMGHAKAVLSVPEKARVSFSEKIVREKLTVRAAEKLAQGMPSTQKQKKAQPPAHAIHLNEIKNKLEERFGTKIEISGSKITFDYYGWDDLDRLLELLGLPCPV